MSETPSRVERIEAALREAFPDARFTLIDESHLHRGHATGQNHQPGRRHPQPSAHRSLRPVNRSCSRKANRSVMPAM